MTHVEQIKFGSEVLVPRHHKPRGTERVYDPGVVVALSDGLVTVKLDSGRKVYCPIGLLTPRRG